MWDALVGVAQHALGTGAPAPRPPTPTAGCRHRRRRDAPLGRRRRGRPSPTTASSWRAPRSAASPVTAILAAVLLDAEGCVLDVGRDRRLVTPAIWTALARPRRPLRLPRLQPAARDVPRPPHRPLDRGRRHRTPQPRDAVRSPPPDRSHPHPRAGPARPPTDARSSCRRPRQVPASSGVAPA